MLTALVLAIIYRKFLPAHQVSVTVRHVCAVTAGLALGFFCFGKQMCHLFAQAGSCYLIMRFSPATYVHKGVLLVALGYLSVMHILRMIYDYGGYTLDVTGPLMVFTQKLTSLAFSVHDGLYKDVEDLSEDQKDQAVTRMPGPLEFCSYLFNFQGILVGPQCFFNDYITFVDGSLLHCPEDMDENGQERHSPFGPSTKKPIFSKLLIAAGSIAVTFTIAPMFPPSLNADQAHLKNSTFLYRVLFVVLSVALSKWRYYFGWKLGEAVNNASGFGFNGYNENGVAKWDLITNVNIYEIETATSLKVLVDNWNIQTGVWLRRVCYDRAPFSPTFLTYMLSALWHGYYPGYYLTFVSAAFFTLAGRCLRKNIRPFFLMSPAKKAIYGCVTWAGTHLSLGYLIVPFCLLEFWPSFYYYQ
ncbi:hypothetical protein NP493_259g00013 [Ridgeia piscesae]|uniref:Uncharacterized protein n=1 Tax=Ridgeia piscesae TaxID=27915 RepID=A0AAD9NY59_RIDPI|nr:hypothetical protein NP493_259g00013 [Ridgeia piscesae]